MNTISVKAKTGGKVPYYDRPREYIKDEQFVLVPDISYYRRMIKDSSLIEEPAKNERKNERKGKINEKKDA